MGHTNHKQRWGIVRSWKRLQSTPDTAAEQNRPLWTARHWVNRYLATGGVLDLGQQREGIQVNHAAVVNA
jgi:hypothetical protein